MSPDDLDLGLDPCLCPDTHDTPDGICDQFLPEGHSPNRRRCEGCILKTGWIHRKTRQKKDGPPVNVTVKLPGAPKQKKGFTADQARVEEASTAWLNMLAGVFGMQGDAVCAQAVKDGAPQVAESLALLAKYHPIIVKILAPVEATGEALAWIGLGMALSPMVLAILVHHGLVSDEVAERVGLVVSLSAVVGNAPKDSEEPAQPQAA